MPRVKVKKFNQVTIPKKFAAKVDLHEGDSLDFEIKGNTLIFRKEEEEDESWFLSPEWQEREREADKAIVEGRVSPIFDTAGEAIKYLRSRSKKA